MVLEAGGAVPESRQEIQRRVAGPLFHCEMFAHQVHEPFINFGHYPLVRCIAGGGLAPLRRLFSFRWFPLLCRNFVVRRRPVYRLFPPPEETHPERVTKRSVRASARFHSRRFMASVVRLSP